MANPELELDTAPADPGAGWMLAFRAGDEASFEALVEHYSPKVWALLTRFLGSDSAREDLVQETFLRVLRAKDRYEPRAKFSTWLYRIVFNLASHAQARAAIRKTDRLDATSESGERAAPEPVEERLLEPDRALEAEDRIAAVRAAIAALPERQRMALVLAKYEELPYNEIGAVMEMSGKAVKSLVHRAREALRASLSGLLAEELQ